MYRVWDRGSFHEGTVARPDALNAHQLRALAGDFPKHQFPAVECPSGRTFAGKRVQVVVVFDLLNKDYRLEPRAAYL